MPAKFTITGLGPASPRSRPRDLPNAAVFLAPEEAEVLTGVASELDEGRRSKDLKAAGAGQLSRHDSPEQGLEPTDATGHPVYDMSWDNAGGSGKRIDVSTDCAQH